MPSVSHPSSSHSSSKLAALPTATLYDLLAPVTVRAGSPRARFTNWGLTYTCKPLAVFEPENEDHCRYIIELARREGKQVRVVGLGHSPSDLACTSGFMMRTENLDKVLEVNFDKRYAVVQAGITLNALHAALAEHGLAMINVGSISDQTIGGVVTTATHGTGIDYPVLSMHIRALVLLLADGRRVRCSREEEQDLFMASICGLGSTGFILEITLDVEPAFHLKDLQQSYSFDDALENMDALVKSSEHVRFWWFPQAGTVRASSFNRTHETKRPVASWLWHSLVGFHFLQLLLFLARYFPVLNLWYGRIAAWLVSETTVSVDDSYRIFNLDCKYPQYTTEWAIPYESTKPCLLELQKWLDEEFADPAGLRPHCPLEVRFSSADDIWLSPSNGQLTCWIGIVQYNLSSEPRPLARSLSHRHPHLSIDLRVPSPTQLRSVVPTPSLNATCSSVSAARHASSLLPDLIYHLLRLAALRVSRTAVSSNPLSPHASPVDLALLSTSASPAPHNTSHPFCALGVRTLTRPYGLNVPYRKLFARFEEILLRHRGKPHWAKTHPLRPEQLRELYPRFDDFVHVLETVDPQGMFRNPYVQRHIFGKQGGEYDARVFKAIQ
ncbi:D-arabinono-1,4-lactone oxidase-domain-containing protein [Daedaleopsis nitida]|nr:D-arabinono-1,4-lactone oxidase-domain-containing protein [Daedaleopsis nitida]